MSLDDTRSYVSDHLTEHERRNLGKENLENISGWNYALDIFSVLMSFIGYLLLIVFLLSYFEIINLRGAPSTLLYFSTCFFVIGLTARIKREMDNLMDINNSRYIITRLQLFLILDSLKKQEKKNDDN